MPGWATTLPRTHPGAALGETHGLQVLPLYQARWDHFLRLGDWGKGARASELVCPLLHPSASPFARPQSLCPSRRPQVGAGGSQMPRIPRPLSWSVDSPPGAAKNCPARRPGSPSSGAF